MNLFQDKNNDDITAGIESVIWKSLESSIKNDSIESFNVLNDFVINVLLLSVKNNSLKHFQNYIIFPALCYDLTFEKIKENIKYLKLYNYVTEISARQIKEIISYYLKYSDEDVKQRNFIDLTIKNKFLYNGFNGFNRLIYLLISNGDTSKFDFVINEYFLIDQFKSYNYTDLKNEIRYNFRNASQTELQLKIQLYEHVKYFDTYKRHVIIGLRYWSIFLYMVRKNDLEITIKYLGRLRVFSDFQERLQDIIYLRNNPIYNYFEWSGWDHIVRANGIAYEPPNPRKWLTAGFLVDLIKLKEVYLSSEFLNLKEIEEIHFLYDAINDEAKILLNNFIFWKPILELDTIDDLKKIIDKILGLLKNIKHEIVNAKDKEIALEELSANKISDFKELIGQTWNKVSLIRNLFLKNKNLEITNLDVDFIGQKIFFEKGKKMFIESDNYDEISDVSQTGGKTARWIDDSFFNKVILDSNNNLIKGNNISDAINKSLEFLENKNVTATTIIIPSEYSYKEDSLLSDPNFKSQLDINNSNKNILSNYFIGKYKELDVYITHSDYILNKVIVADFYNAFIMKYKSNHNWYFGELKVEVNSINDEEAENLYNLNPNRWAIRDDGINLTKEEAIILIKNAVNLEIGSYTEFEIANTNNYTIGLIESKIDQ